uniref:Uncharacterized protein n=1 Tax=Oryza sativa subsp. japonica TaxID=39947 RepID=Q6ZL87_ORYSJ|nr:hypothetical protein [Oryza sativa Japonica Group]BAD30474.1 hypothetical protein [Oryza sativa Japonica Group]
MVSARMAGNTSADTDSVRFLPRNAARRRTPSPRQDTVLFGENASSSDFEKKKSDTSFFDFAACSFCQVLSLLHVLSF